MGTPAKVRAGRSPAAPHAIPDRPVMPPERRGFRLTFNNVDRGVNLQESVVLSRHPSETEEHLVLRVMAYMLLYEPGLAFGPGVCVGDAPDLVARDLTGQTSKWVACGDVSPRLAQKILQHNRLAEVHVVFGDPDRRAAFLAEVDKWGQQRPRGWERLFLWTVDPALVRFLAGGRHLRQSWVVTIVGDHIYAEADGVPAEGDILLG